MNEENVGTSHRKRRRTTRHRSARVSRESKQTVQKNVTVPLHLYEQHSLALIVSKLAKRHMNNSTSREKREIEEGNGVAEADHPSKRLKICTDGLWTTNLASQNEGVAQGEQGSTSLVLPPDVWGMVMNYLDFGSLLSCSAASKTMLNDAMPLVTSLHIDKASQMNSVLAARLSSWQATSSCAMVHYRTLS